MPSRSNMSIARITRGAAIAALAFTGALCAQEESQENPYELISVARFGERATAVIGMGENRRLVKLGKPLANTGYVLTEVDVSYVELTKDGEVITLSLDKADEASIARRKAAREIADAEKEKLAKSEEEKAKKEPKKESKALVGLRDQLNKKLEKWEFDGSDVQGIATLLRKWTAGKEGGPLMVRVLSHAGAEPVSVRASGENNSITDILNLLNKDFNVPYAATPDGKILLGNGYKFQRHLVKPEETVEMIAEQHRADAGLIGEVNNGKFKAGKSVIIPVPANQ